MGWMPLIVDRVGEPPSEAARTAGARRFAGRR
jgi:hypothetical protein